MIKSQKSRKSVLDIEVKFTLDIDCFQYNSQSIDCVELFTIRKHGYTTSSAPLSNYEKKTKLVLSFFIVTTLSGNSLISLGSLIWRLPENSTVRKFDFKARFQIILS